MEQHTCSIPPLHSSTLTQPSLTRRTVPQRPIDYPFSWIYRTPRRSCNSFEKENGMIRIKKISRPQRKKEEAPWENRIVLNDCGRARERTKGIGGNSWEFGFPPFNRVFP